MRAMIDARRLTSRTLTRAMLAALGVLFVVCSATAVGAVLTINRSGDDARVSGELAAAYLSAQNALSREDDAEDAYKREPDPALRQQFERSAVQMRAALTRIQRADEAPDRALARRTLSVHEVYVSATRDTSMQPTATTPSVWTRSTPSAATPRRTSSGCS
jgi:hypothetical protein